jgi:hypothetical protein
MLVNEELHSLALFASAACLRMPAAVVNAVELLPAPDEDF